MNATLARSVTLISEGRCWECSGQLTAEAAWAACHNCGRAFKLTSARLVERVRPIPELVGRPIHEGCLDMGMLLVLPDELRPLVADDHGYVTIPADTAWLQFEIPL